jgi:hypothetical protein
MNDKKLLREICQIFDRIRLNSASELDIASLVINRKFISKNATLSVSYALTTNARFELGEEAISESSFFSYYYAKKVLKGRFVEGEKAIAEVAENSYLYALYVLKARFTEGEKAISPSDYDLTYRYFLNNMVNQNDHQ